MKFLKSFLFITCLLFVNSIHSQELKLKIKKWKLYKDSELVLKGASGDAIIKTLEINKSEDFKNLRLYIWNNYDYQNILVKKTVKCFCNEENPSLIKSFESEAKLFTGFTISKNELLRISKKCSNGDFGVIYFDDINNGIVFMVKNTHL